MWGLFDESQLSGGWLSWMGFRVAGRPEAGEFWAVERAAEGSVLVCATRADLLASCGMSRVGACGIYCAQRAGARADGVELAVFESIVGVERAAALTEEMRERAWPMNLPTLAVFVKAGEAHRAAVRRYAAVAEGHQVQRAAVASGG